MVTRSSAAVETCLFIIGGGPAGLATALAARKRGLDVIVADRGQPPVDKACGEGIMPDGVAALREMGVELTAADGPPFRGIRFLDCSTIQAEAAFPNGQCGFGVRRTRLHQILADAAERAGATLWWQSPVEDLAEGTVTAGGRAVHCQWIVGADGAQSRVREWCGLKPAWTTARRVGLRQHFRIEPWTDFVEVYWCQQAQAYVTAVGPDEVCVAFLGIPKGAATEDWLGLFPALAKRLAGAEPAGARRGAVPMSSRLTGVTRGSVALVGDASGTVDAITGEGLHLAFRQAAALADAIAAGDLRRYETAHRQLQRMPQHMARLLLLLGGNGRLRRAAFRTLSAAPAVFNGLLAFHIGARRTPGIPLGLLGGAVRLLSSPRLLGPRV
jgi:flavin-dependent dehydrogenase